jgi:S1-C subfamily serine protease
VADRLGVSGVDRGAVIVNVTSDSPAERVGFQPGDVVLSLQGKAVTTGKELARIAEANARLWRIKFSRDGRVSSVVIGG